MERDFYFLTLYTRYNKIFDRFSLLQGELKMNEIQLRSIGVLRQTRSEKYPVVIQRGKLPPLKEFETHAYPHRTVRSILSQPRTEIGQLAQVSNEVENTVVASSLVWVPIVDRVCSCPTEKLSR